MTIHPDSIDRTAKLFVDSGDATSIEEADAILRQYVVQIDVGTGLETNRSRQAATLTAVNAASRAFRGDVRIRLAGGDPVVSIGWDRGRRLSEAVERLGGVVVSELNDEVPTICIGEVPPDVVGRPVLRATFDGWAAGVVEGITTPLRERDWFVPAGVAAASIAVGEAFEFRRGDLRAGRRSQGISLWHPGLDWRVPEAAGPDDVAIAQNRWWIVGLGHLGQAYCWTIGLLPYAEPADVRLMLQDDDRIAEANESTGLLTPVEAWRGRRKTRALANVLEELGFQTTISERRLQVGQGPSADEPRLALFGVDNAETRAGLSDMGFALAVDAGLGRGSERYSDIVIHVFPAGRRSGEVPGWRTRAQTVPPSMLDLPAYKRITEEAGDDCGTVEIAGRSVAAAFVGATAASMVIAEATRALLGEQRFAVVNASLRDLSTIQALEATDPSSVSNTGFGRLR